MGKKRRLNKFISKWIKSELPDDCSSVLLLSVNQTPPSPKSKRRPFSLPLSALGVVSSCSKAQVRRNSSGASNIGRRSSVSRRDSIRRGLVVAVAKGERSGARPPQEEDASDKYHSQRDRVGNLNDLNARQQTPDLDTSRNGIYIPNDIDIKQYYYQKSDDDKTAITTTDVDKNNRTSQVLRKSNGSRFKVSVIKPQKEQSDFNFIKKQINDRRSAFLNHDHNSPDTSPIVARVTVTVSSPNDPKRSPFNNSVSSIESPSPSVSINTTPRTTRSATSEFPLSLTPSSECTVSPSSIGDDPLMVTMETSVDSIGTCSLDMEASRELPSDWSEVSSTGTLRSATFLTPSLHHQEQQHHLPSYLSLACTVNGYSTTTNYDPIRLARSRDASPHRVEHGSHLTGTPLSYSVKNNLLSPPNLVPLPTPKVDMTENALRSRHHQEFYSSTKTMTFLSSKETHFSNSIFAKDSIDGCLENTHRAFQRKCVTYESKNMSSLNDQSKCTIESSSVKKEYTNGKETKSFIQQRVERLYGPGALAQGFFVSKRQKDRLSESEDSTKYQDADKDKHNKTLPDKLLDEENIEPPMRQSSSSPSLPVLRHLRPEFRAQLPIASSRKTTESPMQKSITVPKLKDEVKVNGHMKVSEERASDRDPPEANLKLNGNVTTVPIKEESSEKDGHYFIGILEEQTVRLLLLADKWELELENPDLSEEVIGKIRSASGKARLLVSQKMQQFKGLCTNNINQSAGEAFPTTNEDLQGFWDMVMLQVDQVDRIFEDMNRLKENNWNEETVQKVDIKTNGTVKTRKVILKPKPTAAAEEARKQREEQRKKMIEERRKAMKAVQQTNSQPDIEIFVPESS